MNDEPNKTDPTHSFRLPDGIELSPEARRLLNRQLNFDIVSRYWVSKILYVFVGCLFLGAAAFLGYIMIGSGVDSLRALIGTILVIGVPGALAWLFIRLGLRY